MALNLVPRTGGEAQEIVSGQPCFWSWAPDGERFLAHLGGADEAGTVAFVGLQGQLAGPRAPRPGIFQSPGIAPSGTRWAYGEIDVLNTTQIVVASQGSRRRTVVGHMGVAALSWSPASDVLAFISPNAPARHCYGPLQLLNPTTDERRYLVSDTVFGFFWSPDGTQIAYLTIDGLGYEHDTLSDTLAVASNTRALARRTEGEPITLTLSVVDVASGERRRLHTFRPLPIFVNQFLPFFDQYAHSHRLWSPDSDALVLPVVGANGPQIMHIPSDGRPPRVLVSGLMAFWSLR
jgi:TolB protein